MQKVKLIRKACFAPYFRSDAPGTTIEVTPEMAEAMIAAKIAVDPELAPDKIEPTAPAAVAEPTALAADNAGEAADAPIDLLKLSNPELKAKCDELNILYKANTSNAYLRKAIEAALATA